MEDALLGIRRVVGVGHKTIINTVINRANLGHLPQIGTFLADHFAGLANVVWHFSALICTTRSPRSAEYLVRYPALMEAAEHATQLARSRGLDVQDMLSSTYAAVPACMVPPQHRPDSWTVLDSANSETGYEDMSRRFVKAHRCRQCAADSGCLGVPQPYAQQFGLDELQPL
jgi:MoaA/NifB/PqqE/SkfB family radical SAM enzyme